MTANTYIILDDGQYRWPARADLVHGYNGDPMSDEACATVSRIPDELLPRIGYGVGSAECVALCDELIAQGAEVLHA